MKEYKPSKNPIFNAIIDYQEFKSPSRKLLLLAMLRSGNWEGKSIFPGRKLLAARTGYSIRWVEILLKEFEADGFIRVIDTKKGGRGHKTEYEICLEKFGLVAAPSPEIVNQAADRAPTTPESPADSPPELPDWSQPGQAEILHWEDVLKREQFALEQALLRKDEVYAARRRERIQQAQAKLDQLREREVEHV